jgi:hypothetical protein
VIDQGQVVLGAPLLTVHTLNGELLEEELECQLNFPGRLRCLDLIEGRRTNVAVRQPKIRVIQDVEEFRAEL